MSGFSSISRNVGQGAGDANISNAASTTQFGESLVAQLTPTSQGIFATGISAIQFVTRSIGAGSSVTAVSGSACLQSGTATTGSAALQMRRGITYRPGQGSLFRGTAMFGTPVANTRQLIGLGNVECGYFFGYEGQNFGIHHFPDGYKEVRKLVVTAGVATSTTVTIVLNSETKAYSIAGGSTVNQTAWEISQQDWTNVGGGWVAEAQGGTVYFVALRTGSRNGTYSASGTGLSATFSLHVAGSTPNATFISQSAWNLDTMDGNGPSRAVLNPAKGNVYQVGFQYLGFGNARFAIEDTQTGQFQTCHMIRNANARTTPVLKDPHVTGLWRVENNGSQITTHMTGTSCAVFVEGEILRNIGPSFSTGSFSTAVSTAEIPILSVRADRVPGNYTSYSEISFSSFTANVVKTSAANFTTVRIYKNMRLTGPANFNQVAPGKSIASYDNSATGFTRDSEQIISTYNVQFGGSISVDLKGDTFFLSQGETLTVTAQGSTNNADTACSLVWFEDQ